MLIVETSKALKEHVSQLKRQNKSIGLVPTMGALHEGHLSLIDQAKENDFVVVTIFVNPLQFNNPNDLQSYPRDLEGDLKLLKSKCDLVFCPSTVDVYSSSPITTLSFGEMESVMEGKFRPGHFAGVGLVVSKLLNLVQPDKAYFGLKDLQQFLIIRQMVTDLSIPVEIIGCPIKREPSGLAMSSRNRRLSKSGLSHATAIYKGLQQAKHLFDLGKRPEIIVAEIFSTFKTFNDIELEYFEIVNDRLQILNNIPSSGPIIACIAAHVEGVRLIDNLYLRS